jgi:hypothetical protein
MRTCFIAGLLSLAALCQQSLAAPAAAANASDTSMFSGWAPYVDIDLWRVSDAVPISEFESDWTNGFSPKSGRNVVLMRNRAAVGMENDRWRMGYEARQGAWLDTNRGTLEMFRLYKQRQDPDGPTVFPADAHYKNWSAQGVRVGRRFDGFAIAGRMPRLFVSVAYYTNQRYRNDEIDGSVRYEGGGEYGFDVTRTDADYRAKLPFLDATPSAKGMSLSVAADVPLSDALSLNVKIDDLWSRMRWQNLPATYETISSNVTETDSQGYLNYRPLLSGRNEQANRSIVLTRYGAALLSYRPHAWQGWNVAAQVERYAGVTIPTAIAAREFGWGTISARVETRFHTLGFGVDYGNFHLLLQTDTLKQSEAKAQALQMRYARAF